MNEGWRVKLVQAFAAKRNDECIFSLYALKTAAYVRVPCASTLLYCLSPLSLPLSVHSPLLPQHLSFLSHIHLRGHFSKYLLVNLLFFSKKEEWLFRLIFFFIFFFLLLLPFLTWAPTTDDYTEHMQCSFDWHVTSFWWFIHFSEVTKP